MNDPRLDSIHLESKRRQEFRAAREQLLEGCGENTMRGEAPARREGAASNLTDLHSSDTANGPSADFVLMDQERVFPLKVGLNTIGRLADNDVVLDDAYVSRRHCAILVHYDGQCELHDIASKNGTLLNGEKIQGPTPLKPADQIRMSGKNLIFMSRGRDQGGHSTQAD